MTISNINAILKSGVRSSIFKIVLKEPGLPIGEIAKRMDKDPSEISKALKQMEGIITFKYRDAETRGIEKLAFPSFQSVFQVVFSALNEKMTEFDKEIVDGLANLKPMRDFFLKQIEIADKNPDKDMLSMISLQLMTGLYRQHGILQQIQRTKEYQVFQKHISNRFAKKKRGSIIMTPLEELIKRIEELKKGINRPGHTPMENTINDTIEEATSTIKTFMDDYAMVKKGKILRTWLDSQNGVFVKKGGVVLPKNVYDRLIMLQGKYNDLIKKTRKLSETYDMIDKEMKGKVLVKKANVCKGCIHYVNNACEIKDTKIHGRR